MTCSKSVYCVHYDSNKCTSPDEHKNCEYWQTIGIKNEEAAKQMFCRVVTVKVGNQKGGE